MIAHYEDIRTKQGSRMQGDKILVGQIGSY